MTELTKTLDEVARRLAAARRVTVVTGAGVSAASGVPTFRGAGGLWRNRQAQQLATPEAFTQDPVLVCPTRRQIPHEIRAHDVRRRPVDVEESVCFLLIVSERERAVGVMLEPDAGSRVRNPLKRRIRSWEA